MKKKRLFRLSGALLAAVLLTGCAPQAHPPGRLNMETRSETSDAETQNAGSSTNAEKVSFWFAGNATGAAVMREIVDGFNASQSDYWAEATVFGSYTEIYSAVQTAIATGGAPDAVVLERDSSIDLYQKGLTVDLTDALQQDGDFHPERFLSVYYDQGVSEDGEIFAMPLYGTTQVLYYNKAAFAAAGVAPESIQTWSDLAAAANAVQTAGICRYGWEPMWGYENMLDAALSNGGSVFSDDGRTVTVNAPEWVEVWEAFRVWLHDERLMRVHSGGYGWEYWDFTRLDALDGSAGGYTGSSGDQADVDFSVVGMLEQPAWDTEHEARPEAKVLLLNVLSTSTRERQNGAYALIRYLIDVPAQVLWTIGTGYIAVNQGVLEDETYQAHVQKEPYAQIPLLQSMHASVYPYDPTGGAVQAALRRAADQVQIENISAQDALDEAQRTAQRALDAVLTKEDKEDVEAPDTDLPETLQEVEDAAL